jgi:hypothetical protein
MGLLAPMGTQNQDPTAAGARQTSRVVSSSDLKG